MSDYAEVTCEGSGAPSHGRTIVTCAPCGWQFIISGASVPKHSRHKLVAAVTEQGATDDHP